MSKYLINGNSIKFVSNLNLENKFREIGYDTIPEAYTNSIAEKLYKETNLSNSWVTSWQDIFNAFEEKNQLIIFPFVKISGSLSGAFEGLIGLLTIPLLDTSNVIYMRRCFYGCKSLQYIPQLDTSKVDDMESCFYGCKSLQYIPQLDTSKVDDMRYCFSGCSSLTTIPLLDTSNVTDMERCFQGCSSLLSIPQLDTSKVTNMESCFNGCKSLQYIPELDTSNVTNMNHCFGHCSNLKRIEGLSFKNIDSNSKSYSLFSTVLGEGDAQKNLRYLLIKDLGFHEGFTISTDGRYYSSFWFKNIENWGIADEDNPDARQSLIDTLITYSFDRRAAGYVTCEITISSETYNLLTSSERTQINSKGYSLKTN